MAKPLAEPGTSSAIVQEVQKLINQISRSSQVKEDGAFDRATENAIRNFQQDSGLRPTGVLDQELVTLLQKTAKLGEPPKFEFKLGGKIYLLSDDDLAALNARVKKQFIPPMNALSAAVEQARWRYNDLRNLNDDQKIVGFCVGLFRGRMPSESGVKNAEALLVQTYRALNAGNYRSFPMLFQKTEKATEAAVKELRSYAVGMIEGAESWATTLEFVSASSFVVLGVLAAPVAASYGMGAVAAGVVAGAGTGAVEAIAGEIGKGIAGTSKGFGDAAGNVLKDSVIGGLVGALTAGKAGEKIIEKLGPLVRKQLTGRLFGNAGEKAVVRWVQAYFKANGAAILEGVIGDTLRAYKSNASGLSVETFLKIVAKQVVTAGAFAKFAKLGEVTSKALIPRMPKKVVEDLISSLGAKAKPADLEPIFAKAIEAISNEGGGKVYDLLLDSLTGKETPNQVEMMLIGQFAMNKKLLQMIKDECEKQAKKKR